MAKAQSNLIGTLIAVAYGALIEHKGTLVSKDDNGILMDVKRARSSKADRVLFPLSEVKQAFTAEGENASFVYTSGVKEDSYTEVTMLSNDGGVFIGTMGESEVTFGVGCWKFLPDVGDVDDEAPAKGKGKAKPAAEEKPAKGKKAAVVEEEEDEAEEADEYEPAVGDYVTATDAEDEETVGEVTKINTKAVFIGDTKVVREGATFVLTEAPEAEAEEEEEEAEEYTPEEGDYVTVTDAEEEEHSGTVSAITAKAITVDIDGEDTKFKLADVTVVKSEAPKKGKGKKAAEADEDEAPAKGKGKGKAKDAEEDDEAPAKGKGKGKAKAEEADDDWDE